MRFLNNLKTNLTSSSEVLNYVIIYHLIQKRVISEEEEGG